MLSLLVCGHVRAPTRWYLNFRAPSLTRAPTGDLGGRLSFQPQTEGSSRELLEVTPDKDQNSHPLITSRCVPCHTAPSNPWLCHFLLWLCGCCMEQCSLSSGKVHLAENPGVTGNQANTSVPLLESHSILTSPAWRVTFAKAKSGPMLHLPRLKASSSGTKLGFWNPAAPSLDMQVVT